MNGGPNTALRESKGAASPHGPANPSRANGGAYRTALLFIGTPAHTKRQEARNGPSRAVSRDAHQPVRYIIAPEPQMIPMFPSSISENRPFDGSGVLLSKILSLQTSFFCILRIAFRYPSKPAPAVPNVPCPHRVATASPDGEDDRPSRAARNPFEREAFVTWRTTGVLTGRTNAAAVSRELRARDGSCPSSAIFPYPGFGQESPILFF